MRVTTGSLASDAKSLDALKQGAARDPQGAVTAAASQFEALFMQMVLKSMREAVPKSGMLEGAGSDVYQSMLDTQFAQALTGKPGGLGELIARQLSRNMAQPDGAAASKVPEVSDSGLARAVMAQAQAALQAQAASDAAAPGADPAAGPAWPGGAQVALAAVARARAVAAANAAPRSPTEAAAAAGASRVDAPDGAPSARTGSTPAAFVDRMWEAAAGVQRTTGVPAGFIVGQAALESGWGRHELRHSDGRSAHNLFGIKAGAGWRGDTVDSVTTEYVDGRPIRTVERFRAYGSYQEGFADWARLMSANPRYGGVLRAGDSVEGFARQLQQAGYATDPAYASKLTRTINQALALRRTDT
jgi:flagellar protein FlgJ